MAKSKEKELLKDVAESKRWLREHPNVEKKYIKMAESYEPKEKAEELDWWQEKGKELQKELTNVMKIESDVAREIAERKVQKTIELLCLCKSQRDKDVEIISKLVEGKARLDSRESVIRELEGKFAYTLKGRFTQKSGNYIISERRWEMFKRGIM